MPDEPLSRLAAALHPRIPSTRTATATTPATSTSRRRRDVPGLDRWLGQLFDDDFDDTCDRLAGVSEPDPAAEEREAALRAAIADSVDSLGQQPLSSRACGSPARGLPTSFIARHAVSPIVLFL